MGFIIICVGSIVFFAVYEFISKLRLRRKEKKATYLNITGTVVDYNIINNTHITGRFATNVIISYSLICYIEDRNKKVYNVLLFTDYKLSNLDINNFWEIGYEITLPIKKYFGKKIYVLQNQNEYIVRK